MDRSDVRTSARTKYSDSGKGCSRRFENLRAFLADQRVRVVSFRQEKKTYFAALTGFGQRVLERAPCCAASCAVPVECKHHFAHQPEDPFQVFRRCRSAERGNGIVDAGLMQPDGVHVAFDNQETFEVGARRLTRFEQPIELTSLVEERGLRRVQVLRLALVDDASAKSNDPPAASRIGNMMRSRKRS